MPKDPLLAWAADTGTMAASFDAIMDLFGRFLPEDDGSKIEQALAELDAKLGFSLRNDLLAHLGPEVGVVIDLPPIDQAAGLILSGEDDGINRALDGVALRMQVDDEAAVSRAFGRILALAGDELRTETTEAHTRICWTPPASAAPSPGDPAPPCLYYAVGEGALRVGFTPQRLAAMASPMAPEASLTAGADYLQVAAHLDSSPRSLLYVNLPRISRLVAESQMVAGMLAANQEAQPLLELLLDPAMTPHGLGTSVTFIGTGARKVTYGPAWMSTSVATTGIVAAIAIPNLINAINRSRQKRTMADIRTVGTVMEAFAVDNDRYPITDGWVPCAEIAPQVTPVYLEELPTTDGWTSPLMCLSDGRRYVIVSPGRDQTIGGDYGGEIEARETADFDEDIVYVDGEFVIAPG
jgi:general secretion pathway protein G